jgi:restriction endonuclease Mrr
MHEQFTDRDLEGLEQGEVRWRNRVRFARLRMKERGLLNPASRRGVWEISDAGRRYLHDA